MTHPGHGGVMNVKTGIALRKTKLPEGLKFLEKQILILDSYSAERFCDNCIAQSMTDISNNDVADCCDLPKILKNKFNVKHDEVLHGINTNCMLYEIAVKILEAVELKMLTYNNAPALLIKTAEKVEFALNQNIQLDGVMSIINCTVLEEKVESSDYAFAIDEDFGIQLDDNGQETKTEKEREPKDKDISMEDIEWLD